MDEMEIIPGGIINKFCGKIPKIENKNPLNPNSFTIKPTVKPMAKPPKYYYYGNNSNTNNY